MPGPPRAQIREPRLVRRDHLGVADELDCLVRQILRQVIAILGSRRRRDRVVVVDEVGGVPLVGLAAHEAVEPFETAAQRPMSFGGGEVGLLQGRQVPFPDGVGVVTAFGEHLGQQRGVQRDAAVAVGKTVGELLDGGHPDRGGVTPGQQGSAGRRAQSRGVELRQPHPLLRDPLHGGHLHQSAEAIPGGDAGVVPHQIQHVGRTLGRVGAAYGLQSGSESRMSTAIFPLNSDAMAALLQSSDPPFARRSPGDYTRGVGRT